MFRINLKVYRRIDSTTGVVFTELQSNALIISPISRHRVFKRSEDKPSYRILKRAPGLLLAVVRSWAVYVRHTPQAVWCTDVFVSSFSRPAAYQLDPIVIDIFPAIAIPVVKKDGRETVSFL